MKNMIYLIPAALSLFLYLTLGVTGSFGAINPLVWVWIAVMFLSAVVMFKGKWYGCAGGIIVGCVLVVMSTKYTGQTIDIERPLGIILCIYYLICGIIVYRS